MAPEPSAEVNQLLRKPKLRILAVVRDHMGGLLQSVPSLRALRNQCPQAKITLLTNQYATPILDNCPYVDAVAPFFQFRQDGDRVGRTMDMAQKLRTWLRLVGRVDLVVHFRYVGPETIMFCSTLGQPLQVGYTQGKFDEKLAINLGQEEIELDSRSRNNYVVQALGLEADSTEIEIWPGREDIAWAYRVLTENGHQVNDPYFVLHPGCHWGCNQWLPERWSTLGDALHTRYGGQIVITGAADEEALGEEIAEGMEHEPIILAGQTTPLQFAAILNRSALVVSVDALPTQICQALETPAVVLMGAGNKMWNGPLGDEPMIMLQEWNPAEEGTQPCDFAAGFCHGSLCRSRLAEITVEDVLIAAESIAFSPPEHVGIATI